VLHTVWSGAAGSATLNEHLTAPNGGLCAASFAAAFAVNALLLGHVPPTQDGPERAAGSTDMGNVSQVIPAIHPLMKIDAAGAVNHQPGFGAACAGPDADQLVADAALALAWTIADIATSEGHRARLLAGPAPQR
jgi:hypothetical protein